MRDAEWKVSVRIMLEISLSRTNANIMNGILSTSDSCNLMAGTRVLLAYGQSEIYRDLLELPSIL